MEIKNFRIPVVDSNFTSRFLTNFKPISILGQGGFGCVFKAEKRLMANRTWRFAVKRIPIRRGANDAREALKEVQALIALDHPGIVRFYDAWKEEPPAGWQSASDEVLLKDINSDNKESLNYTYDCAFLYIQMELCKSTLSEWLSSHRYRNITRMKYWFKQIVFAVDYIHRQGKIHRDLKPNNILLAGPDLLKICDLGILTDCDFLDDSGAQEVSTIRTYGKGTSSYMAPEQKGCYLYTSKVDVFALGLICTELFLVMTKDETERIFQNYRGARDRNLLREQVADNNEHRMVNDIMEGLPELEKFVFWLTAPNRINRPDCEQILSSAFLAEYQFLKTPIRNQRDLFDQNTASSTLESSSTSDTFSSEFQDKYEKICVIGRGQFGCVFEAEKKVANKIMWKCAIKRVPMKKCERLMDILREIEKLTYFDHPGLVEYQNAWKEEPPKCEHSSRTNCAYIFIQMEIFHSNLEKWLMENYQRDFVKIMLWFEQLLAAVIYLHDIGKIHRNLKPSNIYITSGNTLKVGGLAVITDCAPVEEDEQILSEMNIVIQKAARNKYKAPEQLLEHMDCSSKVDVFALGLILCELCIVMTVDQAEEVFNVYRSPNRECLDDLFTILFHYSKYGWNIKIRSEFPEIFNILDWILQINDGKRPDPQEILDIFRSCYSLKKVRNPSALRETHFESSSFKSRLEKDFNVRGILGQGSFSCVFEVCSPLGMFAIKRIPILQGTMQRNKWIVNTLYNLAKFDGIVKYYDAWVERPPVGIQAKLDENLLPKLGHKMMFKYPNDCSFIYLKMELCPYNLEDWLFANENRDLAQVKLWFKQMACAVAFLHWKKIIHRNLKPRSIMFDMNGRIKIGEIDMYSQLLGQEESIVKSYKCMDVGSPLYMAPEQRLRTSDYKVDVFSLGLILTELSVPISSTDKVDKFEDFRRGNNTTVLKEHPETSELVELLTNINSEKRPTCADILKHPFLAGVSSPEHAKNK